MRAPTLSGGVWSICRQHASGSVSLPEGLCSSRMLCPQSTVKDGTAMRLLPRAANGLVVLMLCLSTAPAQDPDTEEGPPSFPSPEEVLKEFDKDGDGELDDEERRAFFEAMRERMG